MESYKSVKLAAVADSFGVSADFMDRELSEFIVAGRLPAKIDKVAGVVETNRCWGQRMLMRLMAYFQMLHIRGSLSCCAPLSSASSRG